MIEALDRLQSMALDELESITDVKALEVWRVSHLGRKGKLTGMLRQLSSLPIEERKDAGARANQLKGLLEEKLAEKQAWHRSKRQNSSINWNSLALM